MLIVILLDLGVGDLDRRLEIRAFKPDDGHRHFLVNLFVLLPEHRFRERGTALHQLTDSSKSQIIRDNIVEVGGTEPVWPQHRVDELLIFCWVKLVIRLELRKRLLASPYLFGIWLDLELFGFVAKQKQIPCEAQILVIACAPIGSKSFHEVMHAKRKS